MAHQKGAQEKLVSFPSAWEVPLSDLPLTPGPGPKTDTPKVTGDFGNQEEQLSAVLKPFTVFPLSSSPGTRARL